MKWFKRLWLPALVACGLASSAYGACDRVHDEDDTQAIYQFMRAKRSLYLEDVSGNFSISGDVRFAWQNRREKHNGIKLTGSGSGGAGNVLTTNQDIEDGIHGSNKYDVEFNLYFDYVTECTWASVQLEFSNEAGALDTTHEGIGRYAFERELCGSGECCNLCLKKAYFGYNILECGTARLDFEIGRRRLYHVFDSRVQFNNQFDGWLMRYTDSWECVADVYVYFGWFIRDQRVDDDAWVIEIGALDICDYGFDLKYSFIDWEFGGVDRSGNAKSADAQCYRMWEFQNSQVTFAYNFNPEFLCTDVKVYGAWIHNHAATARAATNNDKENNAWYVGVLFGKVKCACDWAVDFTYEYVEAQAIPDCDMHGIGRGNVLRAPFAQNNAFGNGNYQGFRIEGTYAVTDNATVSAEYNYSDEAESAIGGTHDWRMFKLEFIYGW